MMYISVCKCSYSKLPAEAGKCVFFCSNLFFSVFLIVSLFLNNALIKIKLVTLKSLFFTCSFCVVFIKKSFLLFKYFVSDLPYVAAIFGRPRAGRPTRRRIITKSLAFFGLTLIVIGRFIHKQPIKLKKRKYAFQRC